MGPANQTLPINTIAVLPCQASGNPKPSIRWFRDQKPITEMDSSSRLMVEETGTLVIDSKFIINNNMVFCYQNCSDLIVRKKCSTDFEI